MGNARMRAASTEPPLCHSHVRCAAMAMGRSATALIHFIDMATRDGTSGHSRCLDDASRKVPVIVNCRPSGDKYLMDRFHCAGDLRALMSFIEPTQIVTRVKKESAA